MSFLRHYLSYATNNEAPDMFHVWGAYTALSAAAGRKMWLPMGRRAVYPNIYAMYVGDAGNGKSEALSEVKRTLSELGNVPISRSVETPEGLTFYMAGNPNATPPVSSPVMKLVKWPDGVTRETYPMTIIANEFINFISKNMEGWTAMLNDIYDEDKYEYRTKNKGEDNLIGPYIVLLGALTTDVSNDLQKARIISTGFARRTIFQYGERKWHDPHAIPTFDVKAQGHRDSALAHLRKIQELAGAFTWDEATQAEYTAWYNDHSARVLSRPSQIKSWYASKPNQVLKIAMLTALSEGPSLVLEWPHFQVALAYLETMEEDLMKIFGGVGRNELGQVSVNMVTWFQNCGRPVTVSQFRSQFFSQCKSPQDMDYCLSHLVESGQVERYVATLPQPSGIAVQRDFIGTPAVMSAFRLSLEQPQQPDAVPSESPSGPAAGAGPSASPTQSPAPWTNSAPTVVPPAGGTQAGPPPLAD